MNTTNKAEVGVIIARFQSPFLHEGHIDILTQVTNAHPRVLVFLGLAPVKCSKNNPLDFATRKAMIEEKFPQVEVHYVEDVGNNELWSKNLDRQITKLIGPSQKVILYGSRDSFIKSYSGKYPTLELIPTKYVSANAIRKAVGIKSKNTAEFREGVVWAVENQYPAVHPTVDFAIVNFEKGEVLLARKPNEELLRFPGGFADTNTNSYEEDVLREAKEETGLTFNVTRPNPELGYFPPNPIYIGSALINDWRYRSEQNKIKTLMFVLKYEGGEPKADDDIADVRWVTGRRLPTWNWLKIIVNYFKCCEFILAIWRNKQTTNKT
jgi:bifunctional NMN adenylyltransferase/nudix hydrolase